jgi:hypothetical protein
MTLYYAREGVTWRSIALSNGIRQETFHARIRRGMDPEEAATKPVKRQYPDWDPQKKRISSKAALDDRGD